MEILPEPLNAVVVGAVGRQKMQLHAARQVTLQRCQDDVTTMDTVVIQDQVESGGIRIRLQQLIQQIQEQVTGLAQALYPRQHPGADVQGSRQVTLFVL